MFPCPALTCRVDLAWDNDWSQYPTTDLDLLVFGVDGDGFLTVLDVGGAQLSSPETNLGFFIDFGGQLEDSEFAAIFVDGFTTNGVVEPYQIDYFAP